MATLLRNPTFRTTSPFVVTVPSKSVSASFCTSYSKRSKNEARNCSLYSQFLPHRMRGDGRFLKLVAVASSGEATETEMSQEPDVQETVEEEVGPDAGEDGRNVEPEPDPEAPASPIITTLELYREALKENDEAKLAEVEAFFKSIEDEKNHLEKKILSLAEELSSERDRVLRISADFDNYRKRTERERLSVVSNAQGEVVENLLPVLDNFERAKLQIKVETEGEEKISNSYQSIYKQFMEILVAIGVVPVETVGKAFDPLLHEAIMREESTTYDEGIVLEEYRKGFRLGGRLLRPSMVKVSAGPGPAKPEESEPPTQSEEAGNREDVGGEVDDATGQ